MNRTRTSRHRRAAGGLGLLAALAALAAPAAAQNSLPRVVRPAPRAAPLGDSAAQARAATAASDSASVVLVAHLAELDAEWLTASARNDTRTAERLLAPDAYVRSPSGERRTRAAALAALSAVVPAAVAPGRSERADVRVLGSGEAESRGWFVQREPRRASPVYYAYRHRWRLGDAGWQIVEAELRPSAPPRR